MRVPSTNPKYYLMEHVSVILHQHNFAGNETVENLNPMIKVCEDDHACK